MPPASASWRHALWTKAFLALGLIALTDWLLYDHTPGMNWGLFALALTLAAAVAHPGLGRHPVAALSLCMAAFFALTLVEGPGLTGWSLFWIALGVAVLSRRAGRHDDAWRWFQRLVFLGLAGTVQPLLDARKAMKRGRTPLRIAAVVSLLAAPMVGGIIFLSLFIMANPVLATGLAQLHLPQVSFARMMFWGMAGLAIWAALRPHALRKPFGLPAGRKAERASVASVILSLALFNGLFALQNGLDIAFLWSGAALPEGVSFADYAHRGAYLLIITALLAGAFVLAFLRPGSPSAERPLVQRLVIVWIAQNLMLVASSALRTLDYVEAYGLTPLRISALIWMGLVAAGLVLVCVRVLRRRSPSWLINANVATLGVVLTACSVIDFSAVAAAWNVRHAREVDGSGAHLDLCYLNELNGAALLPLLDLERTPLPGDLHGHVVWTRSMIMARMERRQADWRSWTFRDQRRLDQARARLASQPPEAGIVGCEHQTPVPPPPAPLTAAPAAGQ